MARKKRRERTRAHSDISSEPRGRDPQRAAREIPCVSLPAVAGLAEISSDNNPEAG